MTTNSCLTKVLVTPDPFGLHLDHDQFWLAPARPHPFTPKSRAKRRRGNRPPKNWQRANWAPSIKGRQRNFLIGSFTFLFSSQANTQERVEGKICSYRQGRRIPATVRASPAAAGVALSLVLISQSTHGQQLKSPSIPPRSPFLLA